jgi:hypothetical protein
MKIKTIAKKFLKGDSLTNRELKTLLSVHKGLVESLDSLNLRKYDLMTDDLRNNLLRLAGYAKARGLK